MASKIVIAGVAIAIILVAVVALLVLEKGHTSTSPTTSILPTTLPPSKSSSSSTTSYSMPPATTTSSSTTSSSSTTTTTTSSSTATTSIPGNPLPYDASNKTVFLYLASLSTTNPYNYNGTSNGQLVVYIPAGWQIYVVYTNYESIQHNVVILMNNTPTPNSLDIGNDGKILLVVGASTTNYQYSGIAEGESASGISPSLSAGYYWFACGISGHAEEGIWGVIVASSSVTVPYYVIT
ncbi:MAG: sulfocyanin [Sulfolobus sp.]|nr:sulfocyanin [Sulfolobus sp.]